LWAENYVDVARNWARVIPWLHWTGFLLITNPTAKPRSTAKQISFHPFSPLHR